MKDNRKYFEIKFTVNGVKKTKQVYCETVIDAITEAKEEFKRVSLERGLDVQYVDCIELGDIYADILEKLEPMPIIQTAENPFWSHPVFSKYLDELLQGAEYVTSSQLKQIEDHFNCEFRFVSMENDASDELKDRYFDGDNSALLDWKPTPPSGKSGCFIVMICDTEDGAQAWWAVPKVDPEYFKI